MAKIIDGKAIARDIRSEIAKEVRALSQNYNKVQTFIKKRIFPLVSVDKVEIFFFLWLQVPGLAVVIVGTRRDCLSYVSMERMACAEVGIESFDLELPEEISEADLIAKVRQLNADPNVHG